MSKKKSPLWNYFTEDDNDRTSFTCRKVECRKKISRRKTGSDCSRLSNAGMKSHLKCHDKEWAEFLEKENKIANVKTAAEEKLDEENEMEDNGVPIFKLRTKRSRNDFFQQNLPDMLQNNQAYDTNDARVQVNTVEFSQ